MSLSTKYNPEEIEGKWYQYWLEKDFFSAKVNPEKEPYSIVIPPPNVTGVLHMGHMLNNTIQDVLIRKARMEGKEACWVPGTDHASIATEAKVVKMLREKGIKKSDLSRDEFMTHAWEWKEKYGGIILEQLKKLGASCDWERTSFTMDDEYYKAVIKVFIDLYHKGYIYRGLRMINWDCEAKTALSNEEVIYREGGENSFLYSVKCAIKDSDEQVIIATQRPETIMGDTAIAVNPSDERHKHLIGKKALVPFINREIPIIGDDYVELDFGTGCLKVTPAHDPNDYEIGQRHNLEVIDTINLDGTLNEKCEVPEYVGRDRFDIRKQIVKDLRAAELLVEEKPFITRIGRSERTNTVVEPKLSLQWFINMKDISRKAHQAVMDDEILLYPSKFKNTYNHWMENVRDWCISRQLWWGHRIPAYYFGEGENDFVVAASAEEALELAKKKSGNAALTARDLKQDEDVLDTWASSWLWPEAVFDGFKEPHFDEKTGKIIEGSNAELDYFYPTDTLVTAPEILFFWVARMIIAGYEYKGEKPFKNVYLTGIVRDKQRRKMSKSLGNSPDPLDLIKQYGADGVRTGMLFSSPAGNDLLFDEKLCDQGKKFSIKLWNAFRFIKQLKTFEGSNADSQLAIDWFNNRFNQVLTEVEDHFSKFRLSDALMSIYKLVYDDLASYLIEMIKPAYEQPIDRTTYDATILIFEKVMKLIHPFMPFISEELWHKIRERADNDCVIVSEWPAIENFDKEIIEEFETVTNLVTAVRNARNSKGISGNEPLNLLLKCSDKSVFDKYQGLISKMAVLSSIEFTDKIVPNSISFMSGTNECFIPIGDAVKIDTTEEKANLQKDLEYQKGFLNSVMKKLGNERFVQNAPEKVIEMERKKQADAEAKIKAIEASIKSLG